MQVWIVVCVAAKLLQDRNQIALESSILRRKLDVSHRDGLSWRPCAISYDVAAPSSVSTPTVEWTPICKLGNTGTS